MELPLFDEVGEVVRSLVPTDFGKVRFRAHRYGLKVWFGSGKQPREHYEAQVIGPDFVDEAEALAIEVGFHAEHPNPDDNGKALTRLLRQERGWRRTLGNEAVAGPFLGRPDSWARISETWPDPDLGDPDLPMELALRLADYMIALEPVRREQ